MKEIDILTFWGVPNYGTFAQAYALQRAIQKLFSEHQVRQIAYLAEKHYKQYYSRFPIEPIWTKSFYRNLGKYINPNSDYHKRRVNFPADYDNIPHTPKFSASELAKQSMDVLVLGSDIVWDYSFSAFDNDPYLFGNGLKAGTKVAYACSFGRISKEDRYPDYVRDGLKEIDYISVRDEKSADIVEDITGIRPIVVLDPTWLWDFKLDKNIVKPLFENYLVVYGMLFTEEFISQTIQYAHENHYKIVCLDCNDDRYDWCDVLIRQADLTSFQWLGLFKYADKIVTSTYHGLIFGLIFNKPLAFCKSDFIIAKASSFLEKLGLYDLYISGSYSVKDMLDRPWDYSDINRIIMEERKQSIAFLVKSINEEVQQ